MSRGLPVTWGGRGGGFAGGANLGAQQTEETTNQRLHAHAHSPIVNCFSPFPSCNQQVRDSDNTTISPLRSGQGEAGSVGVGAPMGGMTAGGSGRQPAVTATTSEGWRVAAGSKPGGKATGVRQLW